MIFLQYQTFFFEILSPTFIDILFLLSNFSLVYQIIDLCNLKGEERKKAHTIIDSYADRGLRSLGVARQVGS